MNPSAPADIDVPDDFPMVDAPAGLSGVQEKYSTVLQADGKYRAVTATLEHRLRRYDDCCRIVEWAVPFVREKTQKPKYSGHTHTQMLMLLRGNLSSDFHLYVAEQNWVLDRVAKALGWGFIDL